MSWCPKTWCSWHDLPDHASPALAPMTTVQHCFYRWRAMGLWPQIDHALLMMAREAIGREASPSTEGIDSQGVKNTERIS